jgi:hypothetical protein
VLAPLPAHELPEQVFTFGRREFATLRQSPFWPDRKLSNLDWIEPSAPAVMRAITVSGQIIVRYVGNSRGRAVFARYDTVIESGESTLTRAGEAFATGHATNTGAVTLTAGPGERVIAQGRQIVVQRIFANGIEYTVQ